MASTLFYYIAPSGNQFLINNSSDIYFLEEEGCGLGDVEGLSERVAYEHGVIHTGIYSAPREIMLRVGILADGDANWRAKDIKLVRDLSPFKDETSLGILRRVTPEGDVRDIGALLVDYSRASADREGPAYGERVLKFWCPDPFFYDPVDNEFSFALSGTAGKAFDISFDVTFGESNINGTITVNNLGDVKSWPTITIMGPLRNPIITNNTTGETMEITKTLEANDHIHVNMRTCTVMFYDYSLGTETSIMEALTLPSVFWALKRGENSVSVTALDAFSGSIIFSYHTRYTSA